MLNIEVDLGWIERRCLDKVWRVRRSVFKSVIYENIHLGGRILQLDLDFVERDEIPRLLMNPSVQLYLDCLSLSRTIFISEIFDTQHAWSIVCSGGSRGWATAYRLTRTESRCRRWDRGSTRRRAVLAVRCHQFGNKRITTHTAWNVNK